MFKHYGCGMLAVVLVVGCSSAPRHGMRMGPPPPGYIRIRGEAVPDWQPADMLPGLRQSQSHLAWSPLGPRPILNEAWSGSDDASGRVVSIAPHPVDPNTVYIASASGGIWRTTDGGGLWTPLTDELSNLNHGCVALDPADPDKVYAATGEYTLSTTGDGLFRSADAGATWQRIGTTSQVGATCSRVIVDPADPQRVHLTGQLGYVRTDNGGGSWTTYLSGQASDLAVNPSNPQIVYVGRHYDGVYRSTNGGSSFTKLTSGLPSANVGRIILALAPSNPNVVYAAIINGSSLEGLYRTADGGNSWTKKTNTPDFPSPQGWYDVFLGVDPSDENTVYAGGVFPSYAVAGVIKTTDGGNNWTDITIGTLGGQLHPDQHAVAFGPDGTVWVGNDGGVWKSANGGQSWINTNSTLTVTQNYNVALHPVDPLQVMGGTQDNGTVARDLGTDQRPQILSGDGGFLAYDFNDPVRRYVTYVYLEIYRLYGATWDYISGPWSGDSRNFISPLVMDPNDARTLLGGTDRVWRTQDADTGANWTAISTSTVSGGGVLNAIGIAPSASNTIYTGSSTGAVYVTTDASTWNNRTPGLAAGQVSDIMIAPADPAVAYVAFHRTNGQRVRRTDDYGLNWTNVTGDMPVGVSARALAVDWRFDPPHLYSGSGVGVYSSTDGGATWVKDGLDLPNVNIGDLAIDTVHWTITVGTYGRGAWRSDLPLLPGDIDFDGNVDLADHAAFADCLAGPGVPTPPAGCSAAEFNAADLDKDTDVDLTDFAAFAELL